MTQERKPLAVMRPQPGETKEEFAERFADILLARLNQQPPLPLPTDEEGRK